MFSQFREKLRSGEEHRAGQTSIGVGAAFLHGQSAVAVRQRLGGEAVAGFRPLCLGQWSVEIQVTRSPLMLTLVACSHRRRTVWSVIRA